MAEFTAFNLKLEISNYNHLYNQRLNLSETFNFAPFEPEYLDFIQTTIEKLNNPQLINPLKVPDATYLRKKRAHYEAIKDKLRNSSAKPYEFTIEIQQEKITACRNLLDNGPLYLLNKIDTDTDFIKNLNCIDRQLFLNWQQNKNLTHASIAGLQEIVDEILPHFTDFLISARKWLIFYKFYMPDYIYKTYQKYLDKNLFTCIKLEEEISEILLLKQMAFINSDLFDCDITKYICKRLGLSNKNSKKLQNIAVENINEDQFFWMNQQIFLKNKNDNKDLLKMLNYEGNFVFKLDYRLAKKSFFLIPYEVSQLIPWQKKFPFPWNQTHNKCISYFEKKSLLLLKISKSITKGDSIHIEKNNQLKKFLTFSLLLMDDLNKEFNLLDYFLQGIKSPPRNVFILMLSTWQNILIRNINLIHNKQILLINRYLDKIENYFDKLSLEYFQSNIKVTNTLALLQKSCIHCDIDIKHQYLILEKRINTFKLYHQCNDILDNIIDYRKVSNLEIKIINDFFSDKNLSPINLKFIENNHIKLRQILDLVKEELKANFFAVSENHSLNHRNFLFNSIHILKKSNSPLINTELDRLLQKNALQYAYRYLKAELALENSELSYSLHNSEPIYNVAYYLGQHTFITGLSLSNHLYKLKQLKESHAIEYYSKVRALANLLKDKLLIDSIKKDIHTLEERLSYALINDAETKYQYIDIADALVLINDDLSEIQNKKLSHLNKRNSEIYYLVESMDQLNKFKKNVLSQDLDSSKLKTHTLALKVKLKQLLTSNSFFKRNDGNLRSNNRRRSLLSSPKILEEIDNNSLQHS